MRFDWNNDGNATWNESDSGTMYEIVQDGDGGEYDLYIDGEWARSNADPKFLMADAIRHDRLGG